MFTFLSCQPKVRNLVAQTNARVTELEEKLNYYERGSREWGIRVIGIKEKISEDTRNTLCDFIAKHKLAGLETVDAASAIVEHCQRLGREYGTTPRPIIANLITRPIRNAILKDARSNINRQPKNVADGAFIVEDMTKCDYERKKKPGFKWNEQ